jgi:hypothetical protein
MSTLTLDGEPVYTLREIAELEGVPMRTVQARAARGAIRVRGAIWGRALVRGSDAHEYLAKRGLDLDTLIAARDAAEQARAEVLAEREERTRGALFDRPDGDPAQGTRER